jgi:hypothetical protein
MIKKGVPPTYIDEESLKDEEDAQRRREVVLEQKHLNDMLFNVP